jgi:hypothetical protein
MAEMVAGEMFLQYLHSPPSMGVRMQEQVSKKLLE